MTNSADPDQMPHFAASDLGLHCLLRPVCPNTSGYYGIKYYIEMLQLVFVLYIGCFKLNTLMPNVFSNKGQTFQQEVAPSYPQQSCKCSLNCLTEAIPLSTYMSWCKNNIDAQHPKRVFMQFADNTGPY